MNFAFLLFTLYLLYFDLKKTCSHLPFQRLANLLGRLTTGNSTRTLNPQSSLHRVAVNSPHTIQVIFFYMHGYLFTLPYNVVVNRYLESSTF